MTRLIGLKTPLPRGTVLYDGRVGRRHSNPEVDLAELHARIEQMRQPETVYRLTPEEIERVIRHEATPEEIVSQRGGEEMAQYGAVGGASGERLRELRAKAEARFDAGESLGAIARQLGVSRLTVKRWKDNDFQDHGPAAEAPSPKAADPANGVDPVVRAALSLRDRRAARKRDAEQLKDAAKRAYEAGESIEAIRKRLGVSWGRVQSWALKDRWERDKTLMGANPRFGESSAARSLVLELAATGELTQEQIAERAGVHPRTVRKWLRHADGAVGPDPEKPTEAPRYPVPDWLKHPETRIRISPVGPLWPSPSPLIVSVEQREYLELHRLASRCEGPSRDGDVQSLASLAMSIATRMLIGEYPRPEVLANEEGAK